MQTALHIYALTRELQDNLPGAVFFGTEFYKKEREAYMSFDNGDQKLALGLSYHPVGYGAFLIPRSKINIDTAEKPWPFFQPAEKGLVKSVTQIGLDRLIRIELEKGNNIFSIVIEIIGPNGNLWLLDKSDKIVATLRHKKYDSSEKYTIPSGVAKLNPFELEPIQFSSLAESEPQTRIDSCLRKNIGGFDDYLVREVLAQTKISLDCPVGNIESEQWISIADKVARIATGFNDYNNGILYDTADGPKVYPFNLTSLSVGHHKYKTLSLAAYELIKQTRVVKTEKNEKETILEAVARSVKKMERRALKIEEDIAHSDRFEEYRRAAELLKYNLPQIKKGKKEIELEDIYNRTGAKIKITLDPSLSPAENAESYFRKYHKAKDGLTLLERRLDVTQREIASARAMLAELENDFDGGTQKFASDITGLLPKETTDKKTAPRLPYKEHTLTTGITIFVGRDGTDNDSTTFGHAKPYELWFHAAQCPGSHVVMKFPDKSFKPSKAEIAETAAVAAYHSKAKNSKTVPVIYTERRFVRKPRKAKPGLVTVEREKMVMVEPKKAE
jgi:predicted ribosome quality control (RQC) complex YloA/Tae2 family protein